MFKSIKFKKWTSLALASAMFMSYVSPFKVLAEEQTNSVDLQVIATSDLHGRFAPFDYAVNAEDTSGSFAQVQTLLKELRKANPNTILVDNGDTIQDNSSALFNNDELHPMVLAMNEMGYDTWTLGNHEFNYGIPTLKHITEKSNATILCGNVFDKDGKSLGQPYKIVEKGGVKVGIIGMVTPHITKWDGPNLEGYTVTDPAVETKKVIAEIKDKVDVMIAVIHVGETEEYGMSDGAKTIAKVNPELAAIVAGHAHSNIAQSKEGNTVITEPSRFGTFVSKIDIKVTKNADGKYVIANAASDVKSATLPISPKGGKPYAADADLMAKLKPYHDRAVIDSNIVIGELKGGDLVPASEVKGIPTAQVQDTAMIDLINKVQMLYGKADVSAAAAFKADANIKEGAIIKAGTASIYKFDNTLNVIEVTGSQLKRFMEWSASYYNTYKPGDLTISFNQNIRDYNYDMFDGVTYDIDISKEAGGRIVNLKWAADGASWKKGDLVKDTDVIKLAVNNYRANTTLLNETSGLFKGEGVKTSYDSFKELGDDGRIRDFIRKYIVEEKKGVITPELNNNWKVVGNNWDAKQRELAVKLINDGKITLPKSTDGRTPNVASVTYKMAVEANKVVEIVSFNDFHGSLLEDGKNIGAAKLAGAINDVRKAMPNTLVVAGGDLYQGSAMSNLKYGKPVSDILKAIGIEASAIGNHEFDWGVNYISEWAKDGNIDFLASNIYDKATGKPVAWAKPYKVVEKGGIKIGLIGLATPETATKTKPENVKNLEFKDPVVAANEWAAYLKNTEKVDVVLALTHLGAMQDSKTKAITGEVVDFVNGVKGVNAVITAHTHQPVAGYVNNIPVVQGYYNGRSLAKISISRDLENNLVLVPSRDDLYNRVKELTVDPVVKGIVDKYNVELKPILEQVVGYTDKELSHDKNKEGVSLLGQWTSDVMREKAGTQIAITNGGGLRTSIPMGDITMGKMYEVMPFDNTLVTMELKGSDIKKVIENGIGNASIGWVQFSGVKVYYDMSKPFKDRIVAMYLEDGSKLDMDKYYTVVTNDFMATGGDGYDFKGAKNVVDTALPIREALVEKALALKNAGKIISVTPVQYLIPASELPVEVPAKLPKTGSPIDLGVVVNLGLVVTMLGVAMIFADKRKRNSNAA